MEAFSLLNYWNTTGAPLHSSLPTAPHSTIVTAVNDHASEAADDEGPFFDLEFSVPAGDDDDTEEEHDDKKEGPETEIISNEQEQEDEEVEERDLDDLFFKGRIVRIDGSQEIIHSGNKSGQFPIPVSLAKSATKFRVFLLGLKRSKSESNQSPPPQNQANNNHNKHNATNDKKFFTVKFKVEEVPIISLLTRASSNSAPTSNEGEEQQKQEEEEEEKCDGNSGENEKKNKKEVVQKYLKMVKPLYIKVSKKHSRNQKGTAEKQENKMGASVSGGLNLKVIAKKHLGKSKSAVVHSMVQNINNTTSLSSSSSSNKRDDSLLQQQDGIQSAILHCKRSFNSSKDGEEATSVLLTQLVGESLKETASLQLRNGVGNAVN